jgi:hypothetical protein
VLTAAAGAPAMVMQPGVPAAPGMLAASAALPAIQSPNRYAEVADVRSASRGDCWLPWCHAAATAEDGHGGAAAGQVRRPVPARAR